MYLVSVSVGKEILVISKRGQVIVTVERCHTHISGKGGGNHTVSPVAVAHTLQMNHNNINKPF